MKKIFNLIIITLTVTCTMVAQEQAVYSQYFVNKFLYNPAVAGLDEEHQLRMNVRAQWTGFPGSPSTYSISYNGPINKNLGLGGVLFTENIAAMTRYKVQMSYAFRYQADALKMALGLSTSFNHYSITNTIYNNPLYQENDLLIEDAVDGVSTFDASLGLFGYYYNYYFGLSTPNLIRSRLDNIGGDANSALFRYYQFTIGTKIMFPGSDIILEPSMLLKKVRSVPFQADFSLLGHFLNQQLTAGVMYRTGTGGSIGLLVGTKISNLRIYYSYDVSFSDFQQYNNGSHELTIGINFDSSKKWLAKEAEAKKREAEELKR